ncbi:MAG: adenosylcobinamide-GDP ribazoletransferase [Tindallia sp. MSAO_Bac2]|nr:MAG: adenosylcobinamide-GDP ribazoletransferase [Tindallia sp. MSAO_Bac2]
MKHIIQAVQFLTTIPMSGNYIWKDTDNKNMAFFPLAGAIIGFTLAVTDWILYPFLPVHVLSVIVLMISFLLTGGIHADGLADTADGCFSGKDKRGILEVMKDSRLGTHGVMAIVLVYLLKFSLLISLLPALRWWTLILMPMLGRLSLVLGSYRTEYARSSGLGNFYIGKIEGKVVFIAIILTLPITKLLPSSWVFLLLLPIIIAIFKYLMHRKIGGMTGDTLGALLEITETLFLLWMVLRFGGR